MTIDQLRKMIRTVAKDGRVSPTYRDTIEREAAMMGISEDELQRIIDEELKGISSSSADAQSNHSPRLGITVKMNGGAKREEKSNIWNPNTGEFGRTADSSQSSQQQPPQSEQPSQTTQPEQASSSYAHSESPSKTGDDQDSKMRRMKIMLIIAGVLLLGLLLFLIFDRNSNGGDRNGGRNNVSDTTQRGGSESDTTQRRRDNVVDSTRSDGSDTTRRGSITDTTRRGSDVDTVNRGGNADTASQRQQRADTTNNRPQRTVTDLDRLASKILEEQGDKHRQDNNIEKAKQLYDSAARKDPNNLNVKRKLDSLNGLHQ